MWDCFKKSIEDTKNNIEKNFLYQAGTGTGKTEIFKFISPYFLSKALDENDNEGKVFGLICHRLCLIKDLGRRIIPTLINEHSNNFKDYYKGNVLAGCDLPKEKIKFYYVNSGKKLTAKEKGCKGIDIDIPIEGKYVSQMKTDELEKEIQENKKMGIHSFFICLYQSVSEYGNTRMKNIQFDWIICDEIHSINTSKPNEFNIFNECAKFFNRSKVTYYFTATPQYDKRDNRQDKLGRQVIEIK